MPEVLSGTMTGQTVATIILSMADLLGANSGNDRFQNIVKRWIVDVLQEIQLNDPKMRRTMVTDAPFTLIAGTHTYDVRDDEVDGGFGWTNCYEIHTFKIPGVSDRPIETINHWQYRNRANANDESGSPYTCVLLDQFRVKFEPTPDQAWEGVGDYYQDLPDITGDLNGKVDWPRAWDAALKAGVEAKGYEWQYTQQPSTWIPKRNMFEDKLAKLKMAERNDGRKSRPAIMTRANRSKRRIPNDRSADIRYRGW